MSLSSAIYTGRTVHTRRTPHMNHFTYTLYLALLDLRELRSGALDMWPLFSSRTAWALTSALERDHDIGGDAAVPLESRLRAIVGAATGVTPTGPVRMLTGLRVLGLEFSPVSFFFVFNPDDTEVEHVVAEVNNIPWFEQHLYVLTPAEPPPEGAAALRRFAGHPKAFHVSPFIDMRDIAYSWLIGHPAAELRMKIELQRAGAPFFMASLDAQRRPFSAWNLLKLQVSHPLQTAKVVLAIMYEAGKLFRRGFVFVPHPNDTETTASRIVAKCVSFVATLREKAATLTAYLPSTKRAC